MKENQPVEELTAVQSVDEGNQTIAIDQQQASVTSSPQAPKLNFGLRHFLARLTPGKGKDRYFCPVCGRTLTIDRNTGAYKCWINECSSKDIREAIAPSPQKNKRVIPTPSRQPQATASLEAKEVVPNPLEIQPEHRREWVEGSGIAEEITKLNLRSIAGEKEIATLLNWKAYTGSPGWYVLSVDPLTGMYDNRGQFKPDIPIDFEKGDNPQKYITLPKGAKSSPIFPVIDVQTWEAIAKKYDLPFEDSVDESRDDKGFWKWVLENPAVPLIITEGIKKGACLLLNRYVPIILTGVWNGQCQKTQLTENLDIFVVPGREVFLGFDSDLLINSNVQAALKNLGELILQKGCNARVMEWELSFGKGIDDFILGSGAEALDELVRSAISFENWLLKLENQLKTSTNQDKKSSSEKGGAKREKLPPPDVLGEEIAEDYRDRLAYNDVSGVWMRYEGDYPGVWSPETDAFVESMVTGILKERGIRGYGTHSFVVNIVKKLRCELLQRRWKQPSANELLPFCDGVLEVATGKLLPHSSGYKFTWALERSHDSLATDWSLIDKFLDHATGGNAALKEILLCFAAAVLRGRSDLQKFVHLIGVAGSGKGVYMRLLVDLIGAENCHTSTLEDWCGNRFEPANAHGKRLIVFSDEDKRTPQLGRFKSLTGGDWLRAEEKGKKAFQFRFDGMIIVASNFPIFAGDNSSALTRRTISVPLNATTAAAQRRDVNKEFQPQLAAFTNHLLTIPEQRVTEVLRGLKEVPEVAQQSWENRIRTDSIASWLNDRVIRDSMATTPVGNDAEDENALFGSYVSFCRKSGTQSRANRHFSSDLLELCQVVLGWTEIEKVHTRTGKFIKGLRLRETRDYEIPTHDYSLFQAVTDSVTDCDGRRDGLELLLHKAVTDCDRLIEFSKNDLNGVNNLVQLPIKLTAPNEVEGDATMIAGAPFNEPENSEVVIANVSSKDEPPDPPPSVTALTGKGFNPSQMESQSPSRNPSQDLQMNQEIQNASEMLLECEDGCAVMAVMGLFCTWSDSDKAQLWSSIPKEKRTELMKLKAAAQLTAQPGAECFIRVLGGSDTAPEYTWKKAILTSARQLPGQQFWSFELENGTHVPVHGESDWLLA